MLHVRQQRWPAIPAPCVLALWHGDAPAFLVAFAKRRAAGDMAILISFDPRGDFLALLCRLLGFTVVRGGGTDHSWEVLINLAHKIEEGACVFLTADGGGSAHVVNVGALGACLGHWCASGNAWRKLSSRDCRATQVGLRTQSRATWQSCNCLWAGSHD